MEFTTEQITEISALPVAEQVTKYTELTNANEATLKLGWDGKANENAENIIQGAFDSAVTKMGIEGITRNEGEKYADALLRTAPLFIDSALAKEKQSIVTKQKELELAIAAGGGEALKTEHGILQAKFDILQQKDAKFKDWEENDWKGKYEEQGKQIDITNKSNAFNAVKPVFPETVNKFESDAKWKMFVSGIEGKFNIEKSADDKGFVLVDKANPHLTSTIEAELKKDETITALSTGRNLKGLGGEPKGDINIDGVPFSVPENPTPKERTKAITDYLVTVKGLDILSDDFGAEYSAFNKIILEKNPKNK
jgi:hypothetical protein